MLLSILYAQVDFYCIMVGWVKAKIALVECLLVMGENTVLLYGGEGGNYPAYSFQNKWLVIELIVDWSIHRCQLQISSDIGYYVYYEPVRQDVCQLTCLCDTLLLQANGTVQEDPDSYLMDEHEDNSSIPESSPREQSKSIWMVEEHVAKGPVDCCGRWQGQGQHIQGCHQVYKLKLLWLPHCMHNLSAKSRTTTTQLDAKSRSSLWQVVERALHCDSMASKCVENVCGSCEV